MIPISSLFLSILLGVYPPQIFAPEQSLFICDGEPLEATIYNNQNGDFVVVKPKDMIDAGGFIVLNWRDSSLMLPRTFNAYETSFSDGKWWWGYKNSDLPSLRYKKGIAKVQEFTCINKQAQTEIQSNLS